LPRRSETESCRFNQQLQQARNQVLSLNNLADLPSTDGEAGVKIPEGAYRDVDPAGGQGDVGWDGRHTLKMVVLQWEPQGEEGDQGMSLVRRGTRRRGARFVRSLILRLMRELKAKTPEQLAEGAGLKKSTILNLERGKDEPRLSTLEKCMRALNVSMAAFEEMLALAQEIRDGELPDQWWDRSGWTAKG